MLGCLDSSGKEDLLSLPLMCKMASTNFGHNLRRLLFFFFFFTFDPFSRHKCLKLSPLAESND